MALSSATKLIIVLLIKRLEISDFGGF